MQLLSSMAMHELLRELANAFEHETGHATRVEAAGGVDVVKRVLAGESADVVVLAGHAIDKLTAEGRLVAGTRTDLVRSGVSVAVRRGAPKPAIDTEARLKQAVLAARTLGYSTGPSGTYLETLFERWGILESIRARIVVPPPGLPVGSLVAEGKVELGFQQLSELLSLPGIEVLGPLPADIQSITVFSGALGSGSGDSAGARALLTYLASPAATPAKRRHGMEPA